MGNGAPLFSRKESKYSEHDFDDFNYVERLCESEYFDNHINDHDRALQIIVRSNHIDSLELLLSHTRIRRFFPLHMAASYAALESIELLISAGFSPSQRDSNKKTALHRICERSKYSSMSSLCISMLYYHEPRAAQMLDDQDFSPVHLAVKAGNLLVIQSLLDIGISFTIPNQSGRSPRHLAQDLQRSDALKLIDEHERKKKSVAISKAPVDPEKIMLIWERFFENCMQSNFPTEDVSNNADNEKSCRNDSGSPFNNELNRSLIQAASGGVCGRTSSNNNEPDNEQYDIKYDGLTMSNIVEWFSWLLTQQLVDEDHFVSDDRNDFGNDDDDDDRPYYVINKNTLTSTALEDHLSAMAEFGICSDEAKYVDDSQWPSTLYDVMEYGWMSLYDQRDNQCQWIHLSSGRIEDTLPIGGDYYCFEPPLELQANTQDSYWIHADQWPCYQWIVILCTKLQDQYQYPDAVADRKACKGDSSEDELYKDEEEGDEDAGSWYYYSRVTGASTWDPPPGWEQVLAFSGGWALCGHEDGGRHYWWHTESGAVAEAEEE